jgi:hypothetical protein
MTTLREAAQQALEALHEIAWSNDSRWQTDRAESVIPDLRDVLAQEQQPVALCDPAEYDDFQGAVSRNQSASRQS